MKKFRFTLEAVRTLRQRREHETLEKYARALFARQQALDLLQAIEERIERDYGQMRRLLAGGCAAAQAAHAQNFHRTLESQRQDCLAALQNAERLAHAACQAMLAARQQREMVDVYCQKQLATHQRLLSREEQKILDEFAARRVTALSAAQLEACP
jgi:flagellar export protein FliJ